MNIVEAPVTKPVRELIAEAVAARKAAIVEGPSDRWDKHVLDQAIRAFANQGRPFSINDLRPLIPEVRKALLHGAFIRAQNADLIRHVGYTHSTLKSTHAAKVAVYTPVRRPHTEPTT